ncbi:DUF1768-domain-containing protein, partial [Wolfiporia cocos MD-104 SS10]
LGPVTPIYFYRRDQPYFEFTNFSPHPVTYCGYVYPTAEHLFQAQKFLPTRPDLAEEIRSLPHPRAALQAAAQLSDARRPDWFDVNVGIMDAVLEAKFTQHPELCELLLSTGRRPLIEASQVDAFWGAGKWGDGRNELGKALMRLRDKL